MGPRGHREDRLHEDIIFTRKLLTSWFKQTRGKTTSLVWRRICLQCRRPRFDPWVGKSPWSNPPQCSCLENPVDRGAYGPWGHKEADTTEWLTLFGDRIRRQEDSRWVSGSVLLSQVPAPSPHRFPPRAITAIASPRTSWKMGEDTLAAVGTWGYSQVTFPGVGRCSFWTHHGGKETWEGWEARGLLQGAHPRLELYGPGACGTQEMPTPRPLQEAAAGGGWCRTGSWGTLHFRWDETAMRENSSRSPAGEGISNQSFHFDFRLLKTVIRGDWLIKDMISTSYITSLVESSWDADGSALGTILLSVPILFCSSRRSPLPMKNWTPKCNRALLILRNTPSQHVSAQPPDPELSCRGAEGLARELGRRVPGTRVVGAHPRGAPRPGAGPAGVKPGGRQKGGGRRSSSRWK